MNLRRIILAAGASSRMGRPKALLRIGGVTALERIARLGFRGRSIPTVVVTGHAHDRIAPVASALGLDVVQNPRWPRGQTSSVKMGIRSCPGADVIIHPVDFPFVCAGVYDELISAFLAAKRHSFDVRVVPSIDMRRGHPLVLSASVSRRILVLRDDEPLHHVLASTPEDIVHVLTRDSAVRDDVDTPEEFLSGLERHCTRRAVAIRSGV